MTFGACDAERANVRWMGWDGVSFERERECGLVQRGERATTTKNRAEKNSDGDQKNEKHDPQLDPSNLLKRRRIYSFLTSEDGAGAGSEGDVALPHFFLSLGMT